VLEHLVEHLGGLELGAQVPGIAFTTGSNTRVSHSCATISSSSRGVRAGAELVHVVQQAPCLVLLDVESGQTQRRRWWCPASTTLGWIDTGCRRRWSDRHLADVEAEVVQALDPLGDVPGLARGEVSCRSAPPTASGTTT
jgi:hypothetical protein